MSLNHLEYDLSIEQLLSQYTRLEILINNFRDAKNEKIPARQAALTTIKWTVENAKQFMAIPTWNEEYQSVHKLRAVLGFTFKRQQQRLSRKTCVKLPGGTNEVTN